MKKRVLIIATLLFGILISVIVIALDNPTGEELENLDKAENYIGIMDDIYLRHPDMDFRNIKLVIQKYLELSEKDKIRQFQSFKQEYCDLFLYIYRETGVDISDPDKTIFKTFSPNGFKDFYDSVSYTGVIVIGEPGEITRNKEADAHIITMAEARGYKLRFEAEADLLITEGRHSLQIETWDAWEKMKESATENGFSLQLVSAFRSIERQQGIFMYRLKNDSIELTGKEVSISQIIEGTADTVIDYILKTSSIPGYSKHHTGYTIYITGFDPGKEFTDFATMKEFEWISADNFYNAKRFGFIPSYPEGAEKQGPEPEAWEFVWVGTEALKQPLYIKRLLD